MFPHGPLEDVPLRAIELRDIKRVLNKFVVTPLFEEREDTNPPGAAGLLGC